MKSILSLKTFIARIAKYRSNTFIRIAIALFWAGGFLLVGWLIYKNRIEIWDYLRKANLWYLLGFLLFYLISYCFATMAWARIIKVFSPGISFSKHIKIYAITLAGRRLPGTLWYVGGRAIYYRKLGLSFVSVSLASILETASWIVSGFLIGIFLIPAILDWPLSLLWPLRGLALTGFFLFHPRVITWFLKKIRRPLPQSLHYRETLGWLLLTAGGWLSGGGMLIFLVRAFMPLPIPDISYILGAWAISGSLGLLTILLPSSFGVTEISLISILSVRLPLSFSITITLLDRILIIVAELIISMIIYLLRGTLGEFDSENSSPPSNLN